MSQPTPSSALPPVGTDRPRRVRSQHLSAAKQAGERLTMLTAYDAVTARIFDEAGIDILLVGDSIGDNMLAHPNTIPVTMDELIPAVRDRKSTRLKSSHVAISYAVCWLKKKNEK